MVEALAEFQDTILWTIGGIITLILFFIRMHYYNKEQDHQRKALATRVDYLEEKVSSHIAVDDGFHSNITKLIKELGEDSTKQHEKLREEMKAEFDKVHTRITSVETNLAHVVGFIKAKEGRALEINT